MLAADSSDLPDEIYPEGHKPLMNNQQYVGLNYFIE